MLKRDGQLLEQSCFIDIHNTAELITLLSKIGSGRFELRWLTMGGGLVGRWTLMVGDRDQWIPMMENY
jgi:hypothetical protein